MRKFTLSRRILMFLLYVSIIANLFLYQMYKDARNDDFAWDLYRKISFAAREHKAEILDGYAIDRPDEYWSKKFVEVRLRGDNRYSLQQQILVEYDNGDTLVIDVVEAYNHDYVISDFYFLKKSELEE